MQANTLEQPARIREEVRGVAKRFTFDNVALMYVIQTPFRVLSWCCVILLAVLSLLPAQDMVRTGIPGEIEHFVAYAGSAGIAIAGYGQRAAMRTIGLFWIYAGVLEYLQHFSPGRHPSIVDFAASAVGVFFGGVAVALLMPLLYKKAIRRSSNPWRQSSPT
jgi:VanZ family protein